MSRAKYNGRDWFLALPMDLVTDPYRETLTGDCQILRNRYWITWNGNILLYRGVSPQCNGNQAITKKLADDGLTSRLSGDVEVRWLRFVGLPVSIYETFSDGEFSGIDYKYRDKGQEVVLPHEEAAHSANS